MNQNTAIQSNAGFSLTLLLIVIGLVIFSASSCQQVRAEPVVASTVEPVLTAIPTELHSEEPLQATPTLPVPDKTPVPTSPVCSPLEGLTFAEVNSIITNPLKLPSPGKDDGHHGIDFSFWSFGDLDTIEGMGINSVLSGVVAGTVENRFPYGYMIMIETPMETLPPGLLEELGSIESVPLPDISKSPLSCPAISSAEFSSTGLSLYLVYAHMLEAPLQKPGDHVDCGDFLGKVGNSGDSSNAHLHFEARIGPSGFRFTEMAHYLNDSSDTERLNYCAWRISGIFQLIDPQLILDAGSQ